MSAPFVDPRGPLRTVLAVEERTDTTLVTLICGHVGHFNQTWRYRVGDEHRCFACRAQNELRSPSCLAVAGREEGTPAHPPFGAAPRQAALPAAPGGQS